MSKLSSAFIALLVLLLLAYGIYDFYLNFEYKEKIIHNGFKGEARNNPFYASRLFLKRMGIPTETKNNLRGLESYPDTDTLLVITTKRTTLSPQRTDDLIEWVKSGGHLIALATRDWKYNGSEKEAFEDGNKEKNKEGNEEDKEEDNESQGTKISPDPLQRFMGVNTSSRIHSKNTVDEEDEEDADEDDKDDEGRNIYTLKLPSSDKPLKLHLYWYSPILVDSEHKSETEEIELLHNNFIVRQKIGNGLITLIADMDFIQNKEIEIEDHAEILWQLAHGLHKPLSQPARIWLIHNDEMPPLWDILWRYFWAFILSLTLLLLFWLVKSIQRFGPIIPKQEENRRSLNEHITSSGNFYWKNGQKQTLVKSARLALTQRLSRIHPGWLQRTNEEQVTLLADQLSMKAETVHRLLYAQNIEQADDFTQLIKQLEEIRKAI